ncbi:MAG TPA: acetylxylan esterase [Gaiellales bacterium]|jgi:cephalosporin-C deacetylase
MPYFDAPLEELRTYRSAVTAPDDLDDYWREAMADAHAKATPPVFEPHRTSVYRRIRVFDVTFSGAAGDPVRAWFLCPEGDGALPCRVTFIGYGGGRGVAAEHTLYAAAGYAELVVDSRAQGGSWTSGHTGDPGAASAPGPEAPGVMTRGILDARSYYYRRLYVDALRGVETAAAHERVDAGRIGVAGFSQGGALALATAALLPDRVKLCQAHMPYLCDIPHAITIAAEPPYTELVEFLAQHQEHIPRVLDTLRYVDNAVLAQRIRASTTVSVGLMDGCCPPSTVFAAYNAITAPKRIVEYHYSGHEVPGHHTERELEEFVNVLG